MEKKDEIWVLEYSEMSHRRGLYPLHITTKESSDKYGPGYYNFKVIFSGALGEVYKACEKKHKELKLK